MQKLTEAGRSTFARWLAVTCWAISLSGCASIKKSDTSRTGLEQLLISSAADKALEKFDYRPIAGAKVFVDPQYLDCVDKQYVMMRLHQHLLANQCTLVPKSEESDVVVEIASGGVGTDRNDLFVGIPEIPLPPPSPIAVPKIAFYERNRSMGTAKLALVAYDTKTKQPVINSGYAMARADHRDWQVLGLGGQQSGSVQRELVAQTDEASSPLDIKQIAARPTSVAR
jgi:hypothetical protein